MYLLHLLGEKFGMPVSEVEERLTGRDLIRWIAYFKVKADREEKSMEEARKKAERESKSKGRR